MTSQIRAAYSAIVRSLAACRALALRRRIACGGLLIPLFAPISVCPQLTVELSSQTVPRTGRNTVGSCLTEYSFACSFDLQFRALAFRSAPDCGYTIRMRRIANHPRHIDTVFPLRKHLHGSCGLARDFAPPPFLGVDELSRSG